MREPSWSLVPTAKCGLSSVAPCHHSTLSAPPPPRLVGLYWNARLRLRHAAKVEHLARHRRGEAERDHPVHEGAARELAVFHLCDQASQCLLVHADYSSTDANFRLPIGARQAEQVCAMRSTRGRACPPGRLGAAALCNPLEYAAANRVSRGPRPFPRSSPTRELMGAERRLGLGIKLIELGRLHARARQHGMGLAAMMDLVLEEVQQQPVATLGLDACVAIEPHHSAERALGQGVANSMRRRSTAACSRCRSATVAHGVRSAHAFGRASRPRGHRRRTSRRSGCG